MVCEKNEVCKYLEIRRNHLDLPFYNNICYFLIRATQYKVLRINENIINILFKSRIPLSFFSYKMVKLTNIN